MKEEVAAGAHARVTAVDDEGNKRAMVAWLVG